MKAMSWRIILLIPLFAPMAASAVAASADSLVTGYLQADVLYRYGTSIWLSESRIDSRELTKSRSVALAAGLSAVIPGAGQAYNKSWIRMVAGAGLEAALITGYFVWRNRGHKGEDEFMDYAHAYWSPLRYAEWLNGYTGYGGPDVPYPTITEEQLRSPETWTPAQEGEVRAFFAAIRAAEEQAYHIETGAAFSHVLPYFGEQQYYELIGKYFQFAPGWSDYNGANDPEQTGPNGEKVNVPADSRFFEYDDIHEHANNLLRRASRVSGALIVNHFLAAIDAAVTAKLHNDRISSRVSVFPNAEQGLGIAASITLAF
jgi:hypothetical protein